MADENRTGGTAERVTLNLTANASDALAEAQSLSRDSKTDTMNKAIQLYSLILRVQAEGGGAYLKEKGGELERLRVL